MSNTNISLYNTILNFVEENTQIFDESHNYIHAKIVYDSSKRIMDSFNIEYDHDILMFAALLHDVCDHKYPEAITLKQLETFIQSYIPDRVTIVMKLIDNISYSKEVAGKRAQFEYPYNLYLDAISDADRLEALGKVGINRCETFVLARKGRVPEDVINHCHEKLLRLYPEKFIKTDIARTIAEPLHREIVEYVEKYI